MRLSDPISMSVSLIIPCYNGRRYLEKLAKSVLSVSREVDEVLFVDDGSSDDSAESDETFTLGVSNTLVGNAWREQMICAIKAEASASGLVDEVVVVNRNGGPTEQIADLDDTEIDRHIALLIASGNSAKE